MPLVAGVVLGIVQGIHESNCEVMAKEAKKEQAETQHTPMTHGDESLNY